MKKAGILTAFILCLVSIFQLPAQSRLADQNSPRFFFITEIGYLSGTGSVTIDDIKQSNEGLGAGLRFIAGRGISDHLAAGLGFGLDGYHDPGSTTFPVFIDLRGHLNDAKNTPFASLDVGYAIAITEHFEKGFLVSLGVGYKIFLGIFGRKAHLLPGVGFNLQQIKRSRQVVNSQFPPQLETAEDNLLVKSFRINLGVEF